jgi:hypothetical protein
MIMISKDKRCHSVEYVIPMKDESNSDIFDTPMATWVYYLDGKKHGRVPVMVLPGLIDLFGGEEYIRSLGYRKHWNVYLDEDAGEFTFGNRASFAKSQLPEDRIQASQMPTVDIHLLLQL